MNARELRDATEDFIEKGVNRLCYDEEYGQTILRALDLLARVEESEDELVRELREARDTYDGYGGTSGHLLHRAAARIVAQDERIAKLEAERDSLKQHTEAMASDLASLNYGPKAALDAYRAAHPKEGA